MTMPLVDWLSLWNLYRYPLFFWVYVGTGVPLRMLMAHRTAALGARKFWFLSSTASAISVFLMPLAAIPVWVLTTAAAGESAVYSLLMAAPIAASLGTFGAVIDALLIRVFLRQSISRKRIIVFLAANTANVALAVGTVVSWAIVNPPEIFAVLRCWR